ncbi:Zinc finger, C3HC4 type (RING finger) [Musa troglodytarum]|uniref:Zinc finger, C3HC4 type (RING finger) n=1 Tax=Musa troglodytarum TaxID=320322 RepID=A0A9E7JCC4_9LILI|nr:Zinc finger, C3HC4 type (RING finger) [Musa troglodytarum]
MARPLHAPGAAPAAARPSHNAQLNGLLVIFSFLSCYVISAIIVFVVRATCRWCTRRHKRSAVMAFLARIPRDVYVVPSSSSSPSPPSTSVRAVVPEPELQSCVICMEEFVSGEELWVLPRCKHLFHGKCIKRWLLSPSMTCPVCRMLVMGGEASSAAGSHNNDYTR